LQAQLTESIRSLTLTALITGIFEAIRQLMAPPEPAKKRRIGFVQTDQDFGKRLKNYEPRSQSA